jgi:hypothetical protein
MKDATPQRGAQDEHDAEMESQIGLEYDRPSLGGESGSGRRSKGRKAIKAPSPVKPKVSSASTTPLGKGRHILWKPVESISSTVPKTFVFYITCTHTI